MSINGAPYVSTLLSLCLAAPHPYWGLPCVCAALYGSLPTLLLLLDVGCQEPDEILFLVAQEAGHFRSCLYAQQYAEGK